MNKKQTTELADKKTNALPRILVVDDERAIRELIEEAIRTEGLGSVRTAASGEEALGLLTLESFDLLLLDVMLPGIDGIELLEKIRSFSDVPVILITARGEPEDKYAGFLQGADDYLVKPFLIKELLLRIQAILRRVHPAGEHVPIHGGYVDLDTAIVHLAGRDPVQLTAREFEIFEILYLNHGKILSTATLCERLEGGIWSGYENTLMSHIRHLREKIEPEPSSPVNLVTVRGLGYRLERM